MALTIPDTEMISMEDRSPINVELVVLLENSKKRIVAWWQLWNFTVRKVMKRFKHPNKMFKEGQWKRAIFCSQCQFSRFKIKFSFLHFVSFISYWIKRTTLINCQFHSFLNMCLLIRGFLESSRYWLADWYKHPNFLAITSTSKHVEVKIWSFTCLTSKFH